MTASLEISGARFVNPWRAIGWGSGMALLTVPAILGWPWTTAGFVRFGIIFAILGGVIELMVHRASSAAHGAGATIALLTGFVLMWTTLVRDDGNGVGFIMLVMAAVVGGFSARFRAAGMARTMLGVAIMQALLGVAIATAPSTARLPDGSFGALLFSGFFTALWLISATFFWISSRRRPSDQES